MTPTTPDAMATWFENWPGVGEVPPDWNQHVAAHLRRLAALEEQMGDIRITWSPKLGEAVRAYVADQTAALERDNARLREALAEMADQRETASPRYFIRHAREALEGGE